MAKILIVEDDPDDREYAGGILQPHHEVDFAANAQEARGKLIGFPPDLLLCDIYMPGEPGMDFAETILTSRSHEIGVVMVTGLDDPKVNKRALDLGAFGYLVKPYSEEQLLTTVREALRRSRGESGGPEREREQTRER